MRITYHVAASADGYIAKPNGDVSWLEDADIAIEETGLFAFMNEIDGIVMGRNTYDFVHGLGEWPYGDKPAWICTSRRLLKLPDAILYSTNVISDVIDNAKQQGVHHLWLVGGGQIASAFLDLDLITDIAITELPVELSEGIPLFANHRLEDLPCVRRNVAEKDGFRQLELHLQDLPA